MNRQLWPPRSAAQYFRSETFGRLLLELVERLAERYPAMDFTDAVATVFVWFERKGEQEPDFLRSGKFRSEGAFRAYVRQALWNAARAAARTRRARRELTDPDPASHLVSPEVSPAWLAAFHECRDRLPLPLRDVFERMHDDEDPPAPTARDEWVASVLGLSADAVDRAYQAACNRIRHCMDRAAEPD